jgi:hypothetical protein
LGEDEDPNGVCDEVAPLKFDAAPNVAGFTANGLLPKAILLRRGVAETDRHNKC